MIEGTSGASTLTLHMVHERAQLVRGRAPCRRVSGGTGDASTGIMRAIASIGLIFLAGTGLIVASRGASSETPSATATHDQQLVVRPTCMNAGASLQLASFGIAELTTDDGVVISTLHVRAVIANTTGDRPWTLDTSRARVEGRAGAVVAPALVNSDLTTLPIAILDPGERRTIDLYFPLAAELAEHGGPVSFELSWPVNTPERTVQVAWFERETAIPQSREAALAAGWGRSWWFDPRYPWPAYFHRPGIAAPRPPSYVFVTKAPRWDEPSVDARDLQPRETECEQW